MGQVLHGSAKTTHTLRSALKRSQASVARLALSRQDAGMRSTGMADIMVGCPVSGSISLLTKRQTFRPSQPCVR